MFTVVGSGFGLYGYLPALVQAFGEPVVLPESYRARFEARPELERFRPQVRWARDSEEALQQASAAVIATPPARQVEVVERCLELPALRTLVLEKPLAPSPAEARTLLARLEASGRRYRVGYTLLHTEWAGRLAPFGAKAAGSTLSITWTFTAHHFAHGLHNWKRDPALGGGPLRFFGIHLLALLARLGYDGLARSRFERAHGPDVDRWVATFSGAGLPDCEVMVDTREPASAFRIEAGTPLVDLADPFAGELPAGSDDRRVPVLVRFLASLRADDGEHRDLCAAVNRLWAAAEEGDAAR